MMKTILITGGAGFIGSSLADSLSDEYKVVCVDNFSTGKLNNIYHNKKIDSIKCNVNRYNQIAPIMKEYMFDYVFHYAAVVGVERTLANPIDVLNDINGIKNILKLSRKTNVKRVFYSSSSEIYGEAVVYPQAEDTTPLNARLPYAIVKNVGESYFKTYKQVHNLDYTIFRFFNTYGAKQSTDFVVSKFCGQALRNEPITIYGIGSQTRTFCYINDNVDTVKVILKQNSFKNQTINIGSNVEISIRELAQIIIEVTDSKSLIKELDPLKEGDMSRRLPDNTRMRNILKRDLMGLKEGITRMLDTLVIF